MTMASTAKTTTIVYAADQPLELDDAEVGTVSAAAIVDIGRAGDDVVGRADRLVLEHSIRIVDVADGDVFCRVADTTSNM